MNKRVEYEVRSVYGVDKFYPRNAEANLFAGIAGTKTLSCENLQAAAKLGFVVSCVPRQVEMRRAA